MLNRIKHIIILVFYFIQLNILAYDTANPAVVGKTSVDVDVNLNPSVPEFLDSTPYFRTIPETQALSSIVLQINATDADGVSQELEV